MPTGQLMPEHRLIERMRALLKRELSRIQETSKADQRFIEIAIDFFRVYTDFCHRGKEEHVLFGELEAWPPFPEHRAMMGELIQEHAFALEVVKGLLEAKERYGWGSSEALADIIRAMNTLSAFYPAHIEKEDKHFPPTDPPTKGISIDYSMFACIVPALMVLYPRHSLIAVLVNNLCRAP
ncbi:MAG: hemerythrin domain-containing protein [Actinomycetota bacterium]|nr:hemerythrin domain-containing protein [Actinomycetota bacterium]